MRTGSAIRPAVGASLMSFLVPLLAFGNAIDLAPAAPAGSEVSPFAPKSLIDWPALRGLGLRGQAAEGVTLVDSPVHDDPARRAAELHERFWDEGIAWRVDPRRGIGDAFEWRRTWLEALDR
ncbi:MAG: hypothetical protein OER88_07975, partial [Planctomycetota bacterium]|nr:hypothetical protein [Planctomycetota bacterium]